MVTSLPTLSVDDRSVDDRSVDDRPVDDLTVEVVTSPLEQRLLDAALRCMGRRGVARTTLDDIAREARCSRATIYRVFPGGKDTVLKAVVAVESERFFAELGARLTAAEDLESLLVAGMHHAVGQIAEHDVLRFALRHETGPVELDRHGVLPHLDTVVGVTTRFAAPWLTPYVGDEESLRATEFVVRVVVSFALAPNGVLNPVSEDDVRGVVRTYVLPALSALGHEETM